MPGKDKLTENWKAKLQWKRQDSENDKEMVNIIEIRSTLTWINGKTENSIIALKVLIGDHCVKKSLIRDIKEYCLINLCNLFKCEIIVY